MGSFPVEKFLEYHAKACAFMKKSSSPQFTPEQELLLWSIRVDHTKDQQIEEILKDGVDWNYVRKTAIQHGIIPLLYKRLKEDMGDLLPPNELEEFRTLFMANAAKNLRLTQQLIRVLDLLADAGVEAMPFKGPALAVQAYGDLSMRSFCDLDILIHEKDFEKTYELLTNNGFIPFITIDSKIKKIFVILGKDFSFSGHDIHLEVHWRLTERFFMVPINLEQFWEQRMSLMLTGKKIQTFGPEDVLIMLCIHGSLHFWQELKWVSDLTFLISNHPDFNWNMIIQYTEKNGLRRILAIGLFLAHEYGGIIYPSEISNIISSDEFFFYSINKIPQNFFCKEKIYLILPLYYIKSRERICDRISCGMMCVTSEIWIPNQYDFKVIFLPPSLFLLYFIIRPFRLLKNFHTIFHTTLRSLVR